MGIRTAEPANKEEPAPRATAPRKSPARGAGGTREPALGRLDVPIQLAPGMAQAVVQRQAAAPPPPSPDQVFGRRSETAQARRDEQPSFLRQRQPAATGPSVESARVGLPRSATGEPQAVVQRKLDSTFGNLTQGTTAATVQPAGDTTIQAKAEPAPNDTGLPDTLKQNIEGLSGMSLDGVRVHYNSPAPARLSALAYTEGSNIHVAPGQERTLPHEAWHVVQQRQGRVAATRQLKGLALNDQPELEREADVMGERAARGSFARTPTRQPAATATTQVMQQRTSPVLQLWGEPDHYAIGQRAGVKAVEALREVETTKKRTYLLDIDEAKKQPEQPEKEKDEKGKDKIKAADRDLTEHNDYIQDPDAPAKVKKVALRAKQKFMLRGPTGAPMSLGAANRFAGDFTKMPTEKDAAHPSPSLDDMPEKIRETEGKDWEAFDKHKSVHGAASAKSHVRIQKEYLSTGAFAEKTLMATNANHFYPLSTIEYRRQHARALQKVWVASRLWAKAEAILADQDQDKDKDQEQEQSKEQSKEQEQNKAKDEADSLKQEANEAFRQAVMIEGFAGHFLADCFAAGHLAPHALGRIGDKSPVTAGARVNTWHDLFNALPNGIPTTLGSFHGDYSMDGHDLEYVSSVISQSLLEIMMPWYSGLPYDGNVVTPAPDIAAIRADPVAGPLWRTMCGDYDAFFQALQKSDGRRKTKMGLSKYILYATSAGSGVSKDEIMPLIARHVFGGDTGLERTDTLQDSGGIRGKVRSIVAALNQVLSWQAGIQVATGLGQDYQPAGRRGPLHRKYLISLRSAQLAKVSPTSNPRKALLTELQYWNKAWAADLKERSSAIDPKETRLQEQVTELESLAETTKEKDRARWEKRIKQVLTGFAGIDSTHASPLTPQKPLIAQGPDAQVSAESSSGRATQATPELLGLPGISLPLVDVFLDGFQALLSDPRPIVDSEHDRLYDLLAESADSLEQHLESVHLQQSKDGDPEIRLKVIAAVFHSFSLTVNRLKTAGRTLVKTRKETFRRDVIKELRNELTGYVTVDTDRLMATTGRVVK